MASQLHCIPSTLKDLIPAPDTGFSSLSAVPVPVVLSEGLTEYLINSHSILNKIVSGQGTPFIEKCVHDYGICWFYCILPFSWKLLFSHSVMSDSLQPHGLQHARLPCTSPSPGTLLKLVFESVVPSNHLILCHSLSSSTQSFPASGSFPALHIR